MPRRGCCGVMRDPRCGAQPEWSYAGGGASCLSVRVLGAFLGDCVECSNKLVARVEKKLKPLEQVVKLRDTSKCNVALQVAMQINRFFAKGEPS